MPLHDHNCKWCRWWDAQPSNREEADNARAGCKKKSPMMVRTHKGPLETVWPETQGRDWCGDFDRTMQG